MTSFLCLVFSTHTLAQFIMSFRDTFTRGSANEHLQYDDTASMFFVSTVLLVLTAWLAVHLLRKILWPWGDIKGFKEAASNPALKHKVAQFKKERRYSFLTFWFVLKVNIESILDCTVVGGRILPNCHCARDKAQSSESQRF